MTYVGGDQRLVLALRRSVENLLSWGIRGQGQSGEGVHDQVDPEKLNRLEDRLHVVVVNRGNEGEQDSRDVDGDLELRIHCQYMATTSGGVESYLQELLHRVVDRSAPFERGNN